jgi:tetratricopeptide (TPR) repeat protein
MRRFLATLTLICLLAAIEMIDSQAQPQPGSSTTDHKDELKSLIELGNTQRKDGQYVACVETFGKAIALLSKPTRDDFEIFYFRGTCSEREGKWPDAEDDFKKALELYPDQPLVLNYLAYNWVDQGVHLDEALRMLRRAAEQRPDDGSILDSLGWANYRLGNFQEAARYLEQAIKLQPDDPDVAKHLGDAYVKLGRADDAKILRSAVQNRIAADELNKKVVELYQAGKYAEAIPLAQQALAIYEKALGPDHPDVPTALTNLAALHYQQGRYVEAEPLLKRALAIREKALGPDHPDVATALNNLAELYRDQGRYAEAEPLYKRALAIWEKALGPDHPDVATALNNLALLYYQQGRYVEAEPLYKRALAIREKALGPDHPNVAAALNNLAVLYKEQGRYAEAEPLYKRSLAIWEKALGPDHPAVATALNNLAELYRNQGRYAEAEPLYKRALAIWEKALGPDHPDVATALNNLAELYADQGRFADALPLYKRALAIDEKALGPDHPSVALALNNLAELYADQGRFADALPLVRRTISNKTAAIGAALPALFGAQTAKLIAADEAIDDGLNVVQRESFTTSPSTSSAAGIVFQVPSRRTEALSASRDFSAARVAWARLSWNGPRAALKTNRPAIIPASTYLPSASSRTIAASSIHGTGAQNFSIAMRNGCMLVSGIAFGPNFSSRLWASSLVRPFCGLTSAALADLVPAFIET